MYFPYMPNEFFIFCAGLFGAAAGSFFHVCIWRIPHDESIVTPGSHCPQCGKQIPWYNNIPILTYLLLGGRSRCCGTRIPIRYFVYEALTALLYMGIVAHFGFSNTALLYIFLVSVLIISSGIDWDYYYIPDRFSLTMIPFSVLAAAGAQWLHLFPQAYVQSVGDALWGIVIAGGVIWLIRIIGSWVFQQEAMGFGDVKLMAYIGGFIGWDLALLSIFLASFAGSIVGLSLKFSGRMEKYGHLPFGPYLALGAYLSMIYGPPIIEWYIQPFST
ncbi:MAG: prepilin peptidase [bacterium]|jgi:leader peptidase (prepilin peptidase)/N-methyltransferase